MSERSPASDGRPVATSHRGGPTHFEEGGDGHLCGRLFCEAVDQAANRGADNQTARTDLDRLKISIANKLSEIECAALKFINVLGIDGGRDIADVLPAVWYTLNQHKSDSVEDISEAALSAWHIYQAAKKSRLNDNPDDSAGIAGINTDDIQDSARQYLITRRLPRIYEKHFGKKFGKSIDRRGNPGPGLRFIQAFLAENGDPMEPEAIKRRFYGRRPH